MAKGITFCGTVVSVLDLKPDTDNYVQNSMTADILSGFKEIGNQKLRRLVDSAVALISRSSENHHSATNGGAYVAR
jgi:hypothetical protein